MARITEVLIKQRRFKLLLAGLLVLAIFLGIIVVPIESRHPESLIQKPFDGLWWAITTITGVGYGDMYPVTNTGKLVGMVLEVSGVLAFGLLVSMVTVALDDTKERYYRSKLHEQLERMELKLERMEKHETFLVKDKVENGNMHEESRVMES